MIVADYHKMLLETTLAFNSIFRYPIYLSSAKLFVNRRASKENPSNDLWMIFNTFKTSSDDRHKLSEDTLLRRKYKEYLIAGGKQGSAFEIIKMMK